MPEEISAGQIIPTVKSILASNNLTSKSQIGDAMRICKAEFAGINVDNDTLNQDIRNILI